MSHHTTVIFDIETQADLRYTSTTEYVEWMMSTYEGAPSNWKDEVKIAAHRDEWFRKQTGKHALKAISGKIVAIGWADMESDEEPVFTVGAENERNQLEVFSAWLQELDDQSILCGYNVRKFDIPFLTMRASLLGVQLCSWWPRANDYRKVVDLYEIAGHGGLNTWHQRFGGKPLQGKGSDVERMSMDQIVQHVVEDINATRQLARAMSLNVQQLPTMLPEIKI